MAGFSLNLNTKKGKKANKRIPKVECSKIKGNLFGDERSNEPEDTTKRVSIAFSEDYRATKAKELEKSKKKKLVISLRGLQSSSMENELDNDPGYHPDISKPVEVLPIEYEEVPVEDFGDALLRGMGWTSENEEEEELKTTRPSTLAHPEGLGLGAKIPDNKQDSSSSTVAMNTKESFNPIQEFGLKEN